MSRNPDSVASLSPVFSVRSHANDSSPRRREVIAVVILMDNAEATEKHFRALLEQAAPNADIIMCRMECAEADLDKENPHYFKDKTRYLLREHIQKWQDVIGVQHLDQVIVTGINRGSLSYAELETEYPLFWNEFKSLMHQIDATTTSGQTGHGFLVCWAAIAGAYVLEGVKKNIYPNKLYGVYDHQIVEPRHELLTGLGGCNFRIPHSRFSYMDETELTTAIERAEGRVILRGPDGPALWTMHHDRIAAIIGHPEYGESTLQNEYKRDRAKFREQTGDPDGDIPVPENYEYGSEKTSNDFNYLKKTLSPTFYHNLVRLAIQRKNEANAREEIEKNQSSEVPNGLLHFAFQA